MPRQALNPRSSGPFSNNGTEKSNNTRCDENFEELFKTTITCAVTPNGTARAYFAPPAGRTLASAERKVETAITSAGTVTAALKKGATRLLSTATVDAKGFTTSWVEATLSGDGESPDLAIADGELVTLEVVSNNPDAVGGPVIFRLDWALQT